jgi:hydroxymethylpyrimidine/phosphomethylpyrimidine kinase
MGSCKAGFVQPLTAAAGFFRGLKLQRHDGRRYSAGVPKRTTLPIALTIAGSDSGGGAGVQADLKTFASLGVHGTSVITCVTAQNPTRVFDIEACSPTIIRAQLSALFAELPPRAVKTGMLYSPEIVREVSRWFGGGKRMPPLIVDPVMVASSGKRLLQSEAIKLMKNSLLPLATLVTPNVPEAEKLTGLRIGTPEDLRRAARLIHDQFGCAALIKGGHLADSKSAVDIFFDGTTERMLSAPFMKRPTLHGTGCTFSAAIVGYCALGFRLTRAVPLAKNYITQSIAQSTRALGHPILNSFWSD